MSSPIANLPLEPLAQRTEGWCAWTFGADLTLTPADAADVAELPTTRPPLVEEAVETLLALNLNQVFPFLLTPTRRLGGAWGGADIEAVDPTGCFHVFEVKCGATSADVIDQVLLYAVQRIHEPRVDYFEPGDRKQHLNLERRIAAFWSNVRTQTQSTPDKSLGPIANAEAKLAELLDDSLSRDELAARARRFIARYSTPDATRIERARGIHIHIVVPCAETIRGDALEALARMRHRGLRVSIWDYRVNHDVSTKTGTLWVRERWVRPLQPGSRSATSDRAPAAFDIHALLATVYAAAPALLSRELRWDTHRTHRVDAWMPGGKNTLLLVLEAGDTWFRIGLELGVPGWVRERKGDEPMQARIRVQQRLLADWIAELAPPPDGSTEARRLRDLVQQAKSWEAVCADHTVECEHSSTLGGARICVRWEAGDPTALDRAARVATEATRLAVELAEANADVLAPFVESD